VFGAKQVADFSYNPARTEEVHELVRAVERRAVKDNMVVDVCLIDVRTYNESVFAFRKREDELPPDFVGFLRRDFPRLEALSDVVGKHVRFVLTAPGHKLVFVFGEHKLFIGGAAVALVRSDEPAAVSFLRILNIVDYVRDCFSF
jgi:hypothetical protein